MNPDIYAAKEMGWTQVSTIRNPMMPTETLRPINMSPLLEIFDWCEANLGPGDYVYSWGEFCFRRAQDATLFRLRWL